MSPLDPGFFTLTSPNPNPSYITDAEWWLWLKLHELEPTSQLGGIYANKPGFHNRGSQVYDEGPNDPQTDYSIRDPINRTGPWWWTKASAIDWTFPEAQSGDYRRIAKYSKRLYDACKDPNDPRPDLVLYDFYGQIDYDTNVEGYNELYNREATSNLSHLWHIHGSLLRAKCGDFWAMWALLSIFMGWTVEQWRASLPESQQPAYITREQTEAIIMSMLVLRRGVTHPHVKRCQAVLKDVFGFNTLTVDGDYGPATESAVKSWQTRVGRPVTGVVDADDWSVLFTGGIGAIQNVA